MKKVLEDLYFGEIQPNISNHDENSRLKKAEQIVDENEEILLKLFGRKRKEISFKPCGCSKRSGR